MAHAGFVHLRVHSAYSLAEGAIPVKPLAEAAAKAGMPAVAITDTNAMFGALDFAVAAIEAGVQPVIGCLIALERQSDQSRDPRRPPPDEILLLAQNATGYANLSQLSSKAFLDTPAGLQPQIAAGDLAAHAEGLIAFAGGPRSTLARLLREGQGPAAAAHLTALAGMFPGRLYVELMRHGLDEEDRIEAALIDLAYARDLPLVATNDVHFLGRDMHEAHDALLCIAQGRTLADQDRRRLTAEHGFKSAEEMRALFADLPEAIANTLVVARRCAFAPKKQKPLLPDYPTADAAAELRRWAGEGLAQRLATQVFRPEMDRAAREAAAKPYRERLAYEIDVILRMKFEGYFLIVSDFVQWAKDNAVPVGPGRGSGAGSVVAWALGITGLDPLRFGLLFERFLNPERVSMPDFDIDFCQERRDRVIDHVRRRYGDDRVAHIITFQKLQARAAMRDVGRVLGLPYGQVDRLAKLVPQNADPSKRITLAKAIELEPRLEQEAEADPQVRRMLDIAVKIEGLFRNASTHAAGVVIGDRPLVELVPLYRDPRSPLPATQFEMKMAEAAGLVKFDFLGLKTLTVLERARRMLADRLPELDWERVPLDDAKTYDMLGRGEVVGVFQLEGQGMRDTVIKLRPDRIEDIIAVVALYRPGPMVNIPHYIARKHGREKPEYPAPELAPILAETFGVIVYQEQVMEVAKILAGYSLGGADLLRRAMGKKNKAEMDAQRQVFVEGCTARGIAKSKADEIFDLLARFADYGFNKSHAAAYAVVSYWTAWLKANHPVEFLASSMSLDIHDTDKLAMFRQEARRMGVEVLPPDVNRSQADFATEIGADGKGAVRYALAAIKAVGRGAMEALVAERARGGPFADLADFADRLDPHQVNRRQLENLVRAGALDSLEADRARLFAGIDMLLKRGQLASAERASNQAALFAGEAARPALNLPPEKPWLPIDRLNHEREAVGFYFSSHPLDAYGQALERLGARKAVDIARLTARGARNLTLAGTVLASRIRPTTRGTPMAFVQLSDQTGPFEVTLFSEVLAESRDLLQAGQAVLVTVEAGLKDGTPRLTAKRLEPLDRAAARSDVGFNIFLADAAPLPAIRKLLERAGRGRGQVRFTLMMEDGKEAEYVLSRAYALGPAVRGAIKAEKGVVDLREF